MELTCKQVWNAELAIKAQNWTDACKFAHQPPRTRRWGESYFRHTHPNANTNPNPVLRATHFLVKSKGIATNVHS